MSFDPLVVRQDFPILEKKINGLPLVYLDSAATSQKPKVVIEAISNYYLTSNANIHRGVHTLADESTTLYENSRQTIANFFGASGQELIFVPNTTSAANGVAYGFGDHYLKSGDVIISTVMEHHSNLVVWQQLAARTGANLFLIDVDEDGRLDLNHLEKLANEHQRKIKLMALTHVSNTLGTLNPLAKIADLVRSVSRDVKIFLDAAQSAPHLPISLAKLKKIGIELVAVSGHKMLGPMGSGCLLVSKDLFDQELFRPWQFGGGMIDQVASDRATFHQDPAERFAAGTQDVASIVGLAAACDYLSDLGMDQVRAHDQDLVNYALERLSQLPEIKLVGPTAPKSPSEELDRIGSVAFTHQSVHAHDLAQILDSRGVAVRSGHHCAMPLHTRFNWPATTRASFQVYNSRNDIDALVEALCYVKKVFNH